MGKMKELHIEAMNAKAARPPMPPNCEWWFEDGVREEAGIDSEFTCRIDTAVARCVWVDIGYEAKRKACAGPGIIMDEMERMDKAFKNSDAWAKWLESRPWE